MQEQAESIDTYITTLRALAETCDFGTLKDDIIRDRIVCGVRENGRRKKLIQESGLMLSKCVDICRANETTTAQLKDMAPSQSTEQEANAVNQREDYTVQISADALRNLSCSRMFLVEVGSKS